MIEGIDSVDRAGIREVFIAALDLPEAERAAFVSDRCGHDAAAGAEVLALLRALGEAGDYLAQPTSGERVAGTAALDRSEVGQVIGAYTLIERLGEGGFGTVYLAEQSAPVRRRVALKILKPGMDSHQVVARFESERQALALMDHPNIARVFDAGETPTGRPYFVMELVRGVPITRYCDDARLALRDRLALFTQVCRAIAHAHQKGIIHRDIKPGNVLVTEHDGQPVPKVIDFGIAKAIGTSLGDRAAVTGFFQMLGTPAYMSPEQSGPAGDDIDTRSDVYSLGVLLYELLAGTTPFDPGMLQEAALVEVQRMIREVEPPRPSTRLSTLGDRLVTVAGQRGVDPSALQRAVRGEMDWVVMRAIEKDRRRRYDSAAALATDIERYLSDRPVEAAPPTAWYRARKFIRRNRGAVFAGSLLLAALAAGAVVSTVGFLAARSERDAKDVALGEALLAGRAADAARAVEAEARARERTQRDRAESLLRFSDSILGSADPDVTLSGATTTREMLDRAGRDVEAFFAGQPEEEILMRGRIGRAYVSIGDYASADHHFRRVGELLDADPDPRNDSADRMAVAFWAAWVSGAVVEPTAVHAWRRAEEMGMRLLRAHHPPVADALERLHAAFGVAGMRFDRKVCDPLYKEALEIAERELPPGDPLVPAAIISLWRRLGDISNPTYSLTFKPDYDAAYEYLRGLEHFALKHVKPTNALIVAIRMAQLDNLDGAERCAEAIEVSGMWAESCESLLGEDHWLYRYARSRDIAFRVYREMPNVPADLSAEALSRYAQAIDAMRAQCGLETGPALHTLRRYVALRERTLGRIPEDDPRRDEMAAAAARVRSPLSPERVLMCIRTDQQALHDATSRLLQTLSRPDRGEPAAPAAECDQAIEEFFAVRSQSGIVGTPRDRAIARVVQYQAWVAGHKGGPSPEQHLRLFQYVEEAFRPVKDEDPSHYWWAVHWAGVMYERLGQDDRAEEMYRATSQHWPMNPGAANVALSRVLRRRGAAREAADTARAGLEWLLPLAGIDYPDTQDAIIAWIDACDALNDPRQPMEWIYRQVLDDADAPTMLPERVAYRILLAMRAPNVPSPVIAAARNSLDRLLPENPASAQLAVAAGMAALRSSDFDAAVERLSRGISLAPSDEGWLVSVAQAGTCLARARAGHPEAARAALAEARAHADGKPGPVQRALLQECDAALGVSGPDAPAEPSPR